MNFEKFKRQARVNVKLAKRKIKELYEKALGKISERFEEMNDAVEDYIEAREHHCNCGHCHCHEEEKKEEHKCCGGNCGGKCNCHKEEE